MGQFMLGPGTWSNMKQIKLLKPLLILVLSLFLFNLPTENQAAAHHVGEKDYWNFDVQPLPNNVTHYTFTSSFLNPDNNVVGLNVYTPPHYAASGNTTHYPVIYLLHGVNGQEANYFNWYSSFSALYSQKSVLSLMEGTVNPAPGLTLPEAIIVFVNGGKGSGYYDWSTPEHGPNSPFPIMSKSIIIHELLPFVDSHFRTIPFRGGRAIEGFSMGGFGAVKFALEYPELFCSAVSYGGSGFGANSKPSESVYNIATANKSELAGYDVRIRLVRGVNDGTPNDNQELKDFLDAQGITNEYETAVPNTVHNWGDYYRNNGDVGLDFHQDCFTANPAPELNQFVYLPTILNAP